MPAGVSRLNGARSLTHPCGPCASGLLLWVVQELTAALQSEEAVRECLGARGGEAAISEAQRVFAEMDTDGSNTITWNEYRECVVPASAYVCKGASSVTADHT